MGEVLFTVHTLIFLGPIGLRLQLAEPNGKQITSHSSIIRGAYWVKITAGKKTAAVLRRRRSQSLTWNKGQAETNTDLFTAANPNTITYLFLLVYTDTANTTTYLSQRTSKLFCRLSERSCFAAWETAANESRWRKQARWRKIATL